jgi:hypothetical protein
MTRVERLKIAVAFSVIVTVVIAGCVTKPNKIDFNVLTRQLQGIIADRRSAPSDLQQAILRLGPVSESPKFWSRIANDASYSANQRQACIMALLQRHGHSAAELRDLAALLNQPTWLKDRDIENVIMNFGPMPVQWTPDDTVIVFRVFPELPTLAIVYVKLAGKVDRALVSRILRSESSGPLEGGQLILDIAFIAFLENEKRPASR